MTANYDDVPITVRIVGDDTKQEKRPTEIRTAHRTFVLTLANPYQQIVGFDPARKLVSLNVIDNNPVVVSGDIAQASDGANTTATITNPNGRMVNAAMGDVAFLGQDELWISAGTYPTKVGITIVREI